MKTREAVMDISMFIRGEMKRPPTLMMKTTDMKDGTDDSMHNRAMYNMTLMEAFF